MIDQIEALDGEWGADKVEALVATAKLAPDAFSPPLIEHLFQLLEAREFWATDASLQILYELRVDPARLARCAMLVLDGYGAAETAAAVMVATLPYVELSSVRGALRSLVDLANPLRFPIFGDGPTPQPDALRVLHATYPAVVEAALMDFLADPELKTASIGARGVAVLVEGDARAASRLARAAISKLARGGRISDHDEFGREIFYVLRDAVALVYRHNPDATEKLMQSFLDGASPEGQGRVFSVYRKVLGRRHLRPEVVPADSQHLALRRLIWAATEPVPDEVQREIQGIFQSRPDELKPLIAQHIDALLGAAAMLDDRLKKLDANNEPPKNFLEKLERINRRSNAYSLQKNLIGWAAESAAGNMAVTKQYLALLAGLPEDRDSLRAAMIGHLNELIVSPEALGAILPTLYSSLVGASVLIRGAAATVIGEMRPRHRDDAPLLLLEAFVTLLNDRYWYVLSAVVSALEHFTVPEILKHHVRTMLFNLIRVAAENMEQSRFLVDCIGVFVHRHATDAELEGKLGQGLIAILERHPPKEYAQELPNFGYAFAQAPAFGRLVIKALQDTEAMAYHSDRIVRALRDLSTASIARNRGGLLSVGLAGADIDPDIQLRAALVEVLTAARDWDGAEQIAAAALAKLPDTRREKRRRLLIKLVLAAVAYERAIAEGRMGDLARRGADWRTLQAELDEDKES